MSGGMFDASKLESSGKGIADTTGTLGDVADARSRNEDGSLTSGEEEAPKLEEQNQDNKTEEEIESARLAEEERLAARTPEQIEEDRVAAETEANKDKTPEQIAEEKKVEADKIEADKTEAIVKKAREEFLKSFGVKTEAELKEKLNPTKPQTEEEKKASEEQYTASLLNFATKEKLFTANDFAALQNLKQTPDNELAYSSFANEYKELNKSRAGSDNPINDEEIREAFNQQYHVNSEDAALKAIGEKQIKSAADNSRTELEAKFKDAKDTYDDYAYRENNSKPFLNFINKTITASIPTEIKIPGKEGNDITYKIKNPDLKEIEKIFVNDKAFDDYLANGESQSAKDYIAKTIDIYLWSKNKDAILKEVASVSYDAGLKKAKVGSTAPFGSGQSNIAKPTDTGNGLTDAEKAKLKENYGSTFGRR